MIVDMISCKPVVLGLCFAALVLTLQPTPASAQWIGAEVRTSRGSVRPLAATTMRLLDGSVTRRSITLLSRPELLRSSVDVRLKQRHLEDGREAQDLDTNPVTPPTIWERVEGLMPSWMRR